MMEFISDFHFLRPYFLLLLLLALFLLFKSKSQQSITDSAWERVCDKTLLEFLLIKKQKDSNKSVMLLRFLILFLLPLALSGPCWQKTENPVLSVNNPLIIALNMSSGMWSKDVLPSRAERAKFLIKDLLRGINATETGLEVYSREPFMISPVSEDKSLVDNLLPAITYDIMPENGDRPDRAINLAVERLKSAHYNDGNIIILTYDIGERFDLALESASKAAADGYKISVIDINSKKNSKLEMLAQKGQGVYVGYNESLKTLLNSINSVGKNKFKQSENMQTIWRDNGYYLLFVPAFLLLYFFRRGVLIALLMFLLTQNAFAGWFLNNNQEAMQAFEKGDYATAVQKFENQNWKASAAYKGAEYEKAAQIFAQFDDEENVYNYANSLAKSGKIKEAIAKYEQVLEKNPDHEDAKFNLEYLKKQQEQQNQSQQNKQNNNTENQEQNKQNTQNNQSQSNEQNAQDEQQSEQSSQQTEQNEQQNSQQNNQNKQNEQDEKAMSSEQETPTGDEKTNENDNAEQNMQTDQQPQTEKENQQTQNLSSGDTNDDESREMQVRKQKFREIKEDKGGLLRAFIKKEYNRRRYKE